MLEYIANFAMNLSTSSTCGNKRCHDYYHIVVPSRLALTAMVSCNTPPPSHNARITLNTINSEQAIYLTPLL